MLFQEVRVEAGDKSFEEVCLGKKNKKTVLIVEEVWDTVRPPFIRNV